MKEILLANCFCSDTAMSVTGPQTFEMHSWGVENSSATGRLPRTWFKDAECICSAGTRVVSSAASPWTLDSVSVAIDGGFWPTSGIGEDLATATSPVPPTSPVGSSLIVSTSYVPALGSGTLAA